MRGGNGDEEKKPNAPDFLSTSLPALTDEQKDEVFIQLVIRPGFFDEALGRMPPNSDCTIPRGNRYELMGLPRADPANPTRIGSDEVIPLVERSGLLPRPAPLPGATRRADQRLESAAFSSAAVAGSGGRSALPAGPKWPT